VQKFPLGRATPDLLTCSKMGGQVFLPRMAGQSCRGIQGAFMNGVAILFAAAAVATVLFAIIATVAAPADARDEDG
jgi:hypothetical protein